jgi:hypothetical protein
MVLFVAGDVTPARAQADPDDVKRGVARISVISGDVSVRRGDSGDWVAGVINAPLLTDDRIATAPNSRAEVQLDAANVIRIGSDAEVRLAELEYGRYQFEVARGTVTYRVLRQSDVNAEVDTPSVSVRPVRQGAYRISVSDSGDTEVTARAGEVEVFTPTGSQWVRSGQSMLARGSASDPEFQIVAAIPRDEWDSWNDSRDRTALQSASYQYVPPGVYGAEDLDRYGTWRNDPEYGYCWAPTVAAGWSPYGSGRWVWEDWYGWTWVSYDPWGWAPYHYGRWFYRDRWFWYPGAVGVRHYWSPALVAFIGWGGGGISLGFGNIGWVPLAPYETFHPWWGRGYYGRGFNRSVNITNINITNIYRNSRHNGIVGMRGTDFEGGRFRDFRRYSGGDIRDANVIRGGMRVAPGNAHLQFSDRQVRNVPRSSPNTRFFTRQQPNQTQRISFAQQRRAFEQGGPARPEQGRTARPDAGARQGAGGPAQAQAGGGWRRFGESGSRPAARDAQQPRGNNGPGARSQSPAGNAPAGSESRGGWQRFGTPRDNSRQGPGQGRQLEDRGAGNSAPRQDTPAAQPRENRSGGWQRFGAPTGGAQSQPRSNDRPAATRSQEQSRGGWSRFGSPSSPRSEPRQQQQEYRTAPQQREPRSVSPNSGGGGGFSSPRQSGGGGGFNAPRSSGGGGGGFSAPRSSGGGGGGGFSAPRSSGGGGGGGFSAPRSSGGGGGGFSAPRSSGGGGGGGLSAPRSGGGGGGGNRGGGGGGNRRGR